MINGKTLLAVVPARGGSKGVPLKNIHPLLGLPLIAHTGRLIQAFGYVDRAVVSTDHEQIAAAARAFGLEVPFLRPASLSGDLVGDQPVLEHALTEVERIDGHPYDVVLMLQPTCPLRTEAQVTEAVTMLLEEGWDAVWTVSPTHSTYHPLKALTIDAHGVMEYFDPRAAGVVARQQLGPTWHRNGAAYVFTRDCLLDQRTIKGRRTGALVVSEPLISIDTVEDFERVEAALRQRTRRTTVEMSPHRATVADWWGRMVETLRQRIHRQGSVAPDTVRHEKRLRASQ